MRQIREGRFMYLINRFDTITFELVDSSIGEYSFIQAVLKPAKKLAYKTNYCMDYDTSIPNDVVSLIEKNYIRKKTVYKTEAIYPWWIVADSNELKQYPPKPTLSFNESSYDDEGTSCETMYADFNISTASDEPILYRLYIRSKKIDGYIFLTPSKYDSTLLYVNYDMINLQPFSFYSATVEAIDTWGRISSKSNKVTFNTPFIRSIDRIMFYTCGSILESIIH